MCNLVGGISSISNASGLAASTVNRERYWLAQCRSKHETLSDQPLPPQIACTNLPTPKGWFAWLARAHIAHMYAHKLLIILLSQNTRAGIEPRSTDHKTRFDANEPIAPYVKPKKKKSKVCLDELAPELGFFAQAVSGLTTGPSTSLGHNFAMKKQNQWYDVYFIVCKRKTCVNNRRMRYSSLEVTRKCKTHWCWFFIV